MRVAVFAFLAVFAGALLIAFPVEAGPLREQVYEVTVKLPTGTQKVRVTATGSIGARQLAEAQYGKGRVRNIRRLWP